MVYFLSINYYSTTLLHHLLRSIAELSTCSLPWQVIIVNNSPDDNSVDDLQREFENITILTATDNLGFGGGCNLGLEHIYHQNPDAWVWLINPDALLMPQALSYIQDCFRLRPSLSILGTRIQASKDDLWFAQGRFNWWTGSLKHRLSDADTTDQPVKVLPSRWVSGCSMIFNLQRFDSCPLFDLNFFLDYEDIEICERYCRQGHTIGVTQAVLVNHAVSAITHRNRRAKFRHATFSKLYFLHKHGSLLALTLNLVYMLVWSIKLLLSDIEVGLGRFLGWADFLGWQAKRLTKQLSSEPFRPRTAFTQSQQTHS